MIITTETPALLLIRAYMTGGKMSIKVVQDTATPLLAKFKLEAHGLRMNTRISNVMLRDTSDHFQRSMGPQGPWLPLAKITIERRRNKSSKQLQDTGQLYQSAHIAPTTTEAAVEWSKYDYDNNQNVAELQNNGGYTYVREPDGTKVRIYVPPREFAWLSQFAIGEIENLPVRIVGGL